MILTGEEGINLGVSEIKKIMASVIGETETMWDLWGGKNINSNWDVSVGRMHGEGILISLVSEIMKKQK